MYDVLVDGDDLLNSAQSKRVHMEPSHLVHVITVSLSHICSISHRFTAFSVCKNIQVLSFDSIKLVHSVFTLMCFVVWVLPKWDAHQIHAAKYQISFKVILKR